MINMLAVNPSICLGEFHNHAGAVQFIADHFDALCSLGYKTFIIELSDTLTTIAEIKVRIRDELKALRDFYKLHGHEVFKKIHIEKNGDYDIRTIPLSALIKLFDDIGKKKFGPTFDYRSLLSENPDLEPIKAEITNEIKDFFELTQREKLLSKLNTFLEKAEGTHTEVIVIAAGNSSPSFQEDEASHAQTDRNYIEALLKYPTGAVAAVGYAHLQAIKMGCKDLNLRFLALRHEEGRLRELAIDSKTFEFTPAFESILALRATESAGFKTALGFAMSGKSTVDDESISDDESECTRK